MGSFHILQFLCFLTLFLQKCDQNISCLLSWSSSGKYFLPSIVTAKEHIRPCFRQFKSEITVKCGYCLRICKMLILCKIVHCTTCPLIKEPFVKRCGIIDTTAVIFLWTRSNLYFLFHSRSIWSFSDQRCLACLFCRNHNPAGSPPDRLISQLLRSRRHNQQTICNCKLSTLIFPGKTVYHLL